MVSQKKNPSYLIKHRQKWQVKLTIPSDVRWAFENKTTFKRSTGCNVDNINAAIIERDRIVSKFKAHIELHRSAMTANETPADTFDAKFANRPYPKNYQAETVVGTSEQTQDNSGVETWIKERLISKAKNAQVLRYDFWRVDKNKVD
jgi:hypothetical protein